MKTFDEIYNELENNNNEELNSAWIEAKEQNKKTKKIGLTIIAILDICIVLGLLKAKSIYRMLPVLPAIFTIYIITIAIIFIATKLGKKQAEFIRKYKNIVVKKIISNFYNNLEYFPEKPMPEYIYKNLGYEFEKYFDVKAANKILAMQILTADIMEELVEFENKTKMKYDVYIKNNNIYLRFHSVNLQISAEDLKNGVLDKKIINKYFYLMNFTYNLSSKLINTINEVQI